MYWGDNIENEEHPATDRTIFTDVEIASKVQKFINENKTSIDSLHSNLHNVHFVGGGRECIKFGVKKILGCFMFDTLKSLDINDIDSDIKLIKLYKELNILHSMFIAVKNIINEKYKDFSFSPEASDD